MAELLDLALAQPADRAGEQPGDLGAERGGDLRRPRQQEVAGEDRLQVAPLGVDRLDAAARVGLVDHVVVVQRAEVDELARDAAAHDVVATPARPPTWAATIDDDRTQPLAAGHDEVRGDLGQVRVGAAHRLVDRRLDALAVGIHRRQREQRGPHRGVGHAGEASRAGSGHPPTCGGAHGPSSPTRFADGRGDLQRLASEWDRRPRRARSRRPAATRACRRPSRALGISPSRVDVHEDVRLPRDPVRRDAVHVDVG